MVIRIPTTLRTSRAQVVATAADAGSGPATIQVRTGSQPTTADDAATGTLLATFTCADPAFSVASGVATLDTTPVLTATAAATGTAGWFRLLDSDATKCGDGSITTTGGGGDMTMNTTSVVSGAEVQLTAGTLTDPA